MPHLVAGNRRLPQETPADCHLILQAQPYQELAGNPILVLPQKYCRTNGGHCGTEMGAAQMGGHCGTNGSCTAVQLEGALRGFPFSSRLRRQEGTAIQMGSYCSTNWRCTSVLLRHQNDYMQLFWFRGINFL